MLSNIIAVLAVVVALLSAVYARQSRLVAEKSNEIAMQQNLRPSRLRAFELMKEHAKFCMNYRTGQVVGIFKGTNALLDQCDDFRWEIERLGPMEMPDIEELIPQFRGKGVQLQRALDRLNAKHIDATSEEYESAEDSVHAIVDWFSSEEKALNTKFEIFLKNA
ncbi:hypothetical protein WG68_08565 [Arsukibacterium ikkense]|uniref:Uncharacterized protein n=1 Tax=Arsukibacterium ikkense TaxID=336831 RepID=A0A0M2V5U5_9GAMM|nr:hypothetical protein [Arsukibacterium ikkense]KKO45759.1 hypothetical protein WG68_08565 [Arsukibacterium ikkense]